MPFVRTAQKYDVFLTASDGKPGARIVIYSSDCTLQLVFSDSAGSSASASYEATTKTGFVIMPMSQYMIYLDLLRNEKPVYVNFITEAAPPSFEVFCQNEPTGEGEK